MTVKDTVGNILASYNDVFADIVNNLIFHGDCRVKEEELVPHTDRSFYHSGGRREVRRLERDVSKLWKQNNIRLACFGLENQSRPDNDMPFRVIGYDGAAYRDQMFYYKNEHGARVLSQTRYPVVTLVLYFNYRRRWDLARSLYEVFSEPPDEILRAFVPDYRINLFEIAYLDDETVAGFRSDFRFVADYYVQKRKNGSYVPPQDEVIHLREVLELMSFLENDTRFTEAIDFAEQEGKELQNMCETLDIIENRGVARGIEQGAVRERADIISAMLRKGKSVAEISDLTDISAEEVLRISRNTHK